MNIIVRSSGTLGLLTVVPSATTLKSARRLLIAGFSPSWGILVSTVGGGNHWFVAHFAKDRRKEENKMRMLMQVRMPHEPFNSLVRAGKAGKILNKIIKEIKPEAVYFTEQNGTRGAVIIIDVAEPSRVPSFAEPFFLNFNADCEFRIVMSPEDLGKAGLEELGKKWA
jgi:hypothetical protein